MNKRHVSSRVELPLWNPTVNQYLQLSCFFLNFILAVYIFIIVQCSVLKHLCAIRQQLVIYELPEFNSPIHELFFFLNANWLFFMFAFKTPHSHKGCNTDLTAFPANTENRSVESQRVYVSREVNKIDLTCDRKRVISQYFQSG